jgi:glycosyltransferase involved in cell wall biosynthesis
VIGATIVARNYLAQARVLAESFRAKHPSKTFVTLVVDGERGPVDDANEPFEVFTPGKLGLEPAEFDRMAAIYDVIELSTALKPWFVQRLLETSAEPVGYFDPDMLIFEELDDIGLLAAGHGLVLTPHLTRAASIPEEQAILEVGVYNLGFLAVGEGSAPFLDWWAKRLARDCLVAHDLGSFVDQRWVDLAPALFEACILRDEGCNVAHWNLHQRRLELSSGRFLVNGRPLRFFHFSGFSPDRPYLLSKHGGARPGLLISESPALLELHRRYAGLLFDHGYQASSKEPYLLNTLSNGLTLDLRMRRLYRGALVESERAGSAEPPNPFSEADRFLEWLREPADDHGQAAGVSRYLRTVWEERPDVQREFNDLRWVHGDRYLDWIVAEGAADASVPPDLLPGPGRRAPSREPSPPSPGVNLVGYFSAEAGIGEAARQLAGAIERAGIPHVTVSYDRIASRREHLFESSTGSEPIHDVNLICVNAEALPAFAYDAGPEFFAGHYSIGVWWWEVAEFPRWMHGAFEIVDEVWVGSEHVAAALREVSPKPVRVFPLPVEVPAVGIDRDELSLPGDRFVFLSAFDFLSVPERKNPLGLVEAFKRAFVDEEGPLLVIKTINGDRRLSDLEALRHAVADRSDIDVRDGYVSAPVMRGLMASCDAYVSLHRSEGFGLTMAEAMACGRPVIATGYSGNLTFMSAENSFLVPYELTSIPRGSDPYPEGGRWAEPDLDAAADILRYVHEHTEEARMKGERGKRDLQQHHSADQAAKFVSETLDEIRASKPPLRELAALPARAEGTQEAARYLVEGPSLPIDAPSRFGPLGVLWRRLVYRLLRPYISRQREFESAVVRALSEVEEIAHRAPRSTSDDHSSGREARSSDA